MSYVHLVWSHRIYWKIMMPYTSLPMMLEIKKQRNMDKFSCGEKRLYHLLAFMSSFKNELKVCVEIAFLAFRFCHVLYHCIYLIWKCMIWLFLPLHDKTGSRMLHPSLLLCLFIWVLVQALSSSLPSIPPSSLLIMNHDGGELQLQKYPSVWIKLPCNGLCVQVWWSENAIHV